MGTTASRWIIACALAEAVGMTASAGAARAVDGVPESWPVLAALGIVVAGGLVEGTALGAAQGTVLAERLPRLSRARWFWTTLAVAGVGWAVASTPAVLSADEPVGPPPPLWLVLLGAVGIGLAMGPVLGGAQALVLRGVARMPWRWVLANTLAWPPVMVVIFLGATRPEASWSVPAVLAAGAVTGGCAGALLGLLTAPWLPDPVPHGHLGPGARGAARAGRPARRADR